MTYKDRSLFDYLPSTYRELRESDAILTEQQAQIYKANADIDDVLAQFFVGSATWGLANWERIAGIETDDNKPIEERRSMIKAKLRGAGVVTINTVKNVAESWYGGETEVIEKCSEYEIVVKFVSNYGIPSNLDDVETALRELIPAHLEISFEFSYLLIRDVHEVMTLSELEEIPLEQFAGGN